MMMGTVSLIFISIFILLQGALGLLLLYHAFSLAIKAFFESVDLGLLKERLFMMLEDRRSNQFLTNHKPVALVLALLLPGSLLLITGWGLWQFFRRYDLSLMRVGSRLKTAIQSIVL